MTKLPPDQELTKVRLEMVAQIKALFNEVIDCWDKDDSTWATRLYDKARFLWGFMPYFEPSEFNDYLKRISQAQDRYIQRLTARLFQ